MLVAPIIYNWGDLLYTAKRDRRPKRDWLTSVSGSIALGTTEKAGPKHTTKGGTDSTYADGIRGGWSSKRTVLEAKVIAVKRRHGSVE